MTPLFQAAFYPPKRARGYTHKVVLAVIVHHIICSTVTNQVLAKPHISASQASEDTLCINKSLKEGMHLQQRLRW